MSREESVPPFVLLGMDYVYPRTANRILRALFGGRHVVPLGRRAGSPNPLRCIFRSRSGAHRGLLNTRARGR